MEAGREEEGVFAFDCLVLRDRRLEEEAAGCRLEAEGWFCVVVVVLAAGWNREDDELNAPSPLFMTGRSIGRWQFVSARSGDEEV